VGQTLACLEHLACEGGGSKQWNLNLNLFDKTVTVLHTNQHNRKYESGGFPNTTLNMAPEAKGATCNNFSVSHSNTVKSSY